MKQLFFLLSIKKNQNYIIMPLNDKKSSFLLKKLKNTIRGLPKD